MQQSHAPRSRPTSLLLVPPKTSASLRVASAVITGVKAATSIGIADIGNYLGVTIFSLVAGFDSSS